MVDEGRMLDDLLAHATTREPWVPEDTKSGARFERVVIGEGRYVLKYQDPRDDWLMRATGDPGDRYVRLWEHGLLGRLPAELDAAVVACKFDGTVGMVLLRDVSSQLLPPGTPFSRSQHDRFLDHMAAMHAAFWGWRDDAGLTSLATRYLMYSPAVARAEATLGSRAMVPKVMAQGWARLAEVSPRVAGIVLPLLDDPTPLVAALEEGAPYPCPRRLEGGQPREPPRRPHGPARLRGGAGRGVPDSRPLLVPGAEQRPTARAEGAVHGQLPGGARASRCPNRRVVGQGGLP